MGVKALFTYDYGSEKMKSIEKLGYDVIIRNESNITYCDDFKDVEALICYMPFSTLDIRLMKKLKLIQLSSIGIDQIPIDSAKELNVTVCNNKGGYSIPMGEWIVMMILQLFKNSMELHLNQLNKKWKMNTGVLELYGKTVGFIGTGTIAVEAAKRLQGFGVNILGLNTKGRNVEFFNHCYRSEDIDVMLSKCDVVVNAIPSTEKTYNLINEERFMAMKDDVFFINIARGNIVDENALIKNLLSGKVKGAALDVFCEEPLPLDHPFWEMSNVIVTPHNSWISEMRNERRFELIYENLKRYLNREDLLNIVDIDKGY